MRADVRTLTVELRRIVHHREEDLQELAVADGVRIVGDLDRFRVAGGAGGDLLVGRVGKVAAGIAGDGIDDPFGMLEHRLHAPEAAAGEDRDRHVAAYRQHRPPAPGLRPASRRHGRQAAATSKAATARVRVVRMGTPPASAVIGSTDHRQRSPGPRLN
jgi:hypothetical protein